MRKLAVVVGVLAVIYLVLTIVGSPIVDSKLNGVTDRGPYIVSAEARALYEDLDFIADLHCDALLWKRPLHKKLKRSHVDLPKLHEANVSLQVFTVVSKSPRNLNFDMNDSNSDDLVLLNIAQGRSVRAWFSLKHRVEAQSRQLHRLEKRANGTFKIIRSQVDLQDLIKANKNGFRMSGGLFGLEGAHPLEGDLLEAQVRAQLHRVRRHLAPDQPQLVRHVTRSSGAPAAVPPAPT